MFDPTILDFAIKNDLNVLFDSHAGVGKTAITRAWFAKHGLNYRMISGATCDPWVDLVGVPKQVIDPETGESEIELITPKHLDINNIEALFVDEVNRAPKKVQNGLMELIQFKSINGRPFPKLRVVWGAMNPESADGRTYNVFKMDDALRDRFEIKLDLPFECSIEYFRGKFGAQIADIAIEWWNEIPIAKRIGNISPRRLEYALNCWDKGGDLSWIVPEMSRPELLAKALSGISVIEDIQDNIKSGKLQNWLRHEDNSFKVTSIFNRLNDSERDQIVIDMPDENVVANATNPIYYANESFKARHRDIMYSGASEGVVLDTVITSPDYSLNSIIATLKSQPAFDTRNIEPTVNDVSIKPERVMDVYNIQSNPWLAAVELNLESGLGNDSLNPSLSKLRACVEFIIKNPQSFFIESKWSRKSAYHDTSSLMSNGFFITHPDSSVEEETQVFLDNIFPREGYKQPIDYKKNGAAPSLDVSSMVKRMATNNDGDISYEPQSQIGQAPVRPMGALTKSQIPINPRRSGYAVFSKNISESAVNPVSGVEADNKWFTRLIEDCSSPQTYKKIKCLERVVSSIGYGRELNVDQWFQYIATIDSGMTKMRKSTVVNNISNEVMQEIIGRIMSTIGLHTNCQTYQDVLVYVETRYKNLFSKVFIPFHEKIIDPALNVTSSMSIVSGGYYESSLIPEYFLRSSNDPVLSVHSHLPTN